MAQANITSHVRLRNHISGYTDVIQMLTGVLLCCFVLMHMVLVSSVILSPKIMDSLAVFLETSYLAQIGGPIILLVMILFSPHGKCRSARWNCGSSGVRPR